MTLLFQQCHTYADANDPDAEAHIAAEAVHARDDLRMPLDRALRAIVPLYLKYPAGEVRAIVRDAYRHTPGGVN